jgi:hypothetical protein
VKYGQRQLALAKHRFLTYLSNSLFILPQGAAQNQPEMLKKYKSTGQGKWRLSVDFGSVIISYLRTYA